ncbi:SDR family NAD(P)-dependent oxidoreductase [Undibacterium sp. SXout11W]|uniref:SDR family NAD(P)-dependent oxidoreductase n=1 Tax=Undibacterium sp. SXout11W TaxID=3413050 RepID=UPI003BF02ED1
MMIEKNLDNKHALITGGGKGIGYAIAAALLAQGLKVTIAGRNEEVLKVAMKSLSNAHGETRIAYIVLDVSDSKAVETSFALAAQKLGPIDILVNNAGQASSAPFLKTDTAHWQQMLNVNLMGTVHCTKQVLPVMLEAGWGRIINVASTAGLTGYPYVSAYCAAKHGVIGLTRALALELATKGVTVNAVCPGYTETDIVKEAVSNIMSKTGRTEEQARAALASGNPQQRLVQPSEVANTVAWLCQTQASAITGQSIAVAGGEVM